MIRKQDLVDWLTDLECSIKKVEERINAIEARQRNLKSEKAKKQLRDKSGKFSKK